MKQFIYRINGQEYVVAVNKMDDSLAEVAVNGTNYKVELVNNEEVTLVSRPAAKAPAAAAKTAPSAPATKPTQSSATGLGVLKSPLPGIVVDVAVNVGDSVSKGQVVMTLEAMKMENALSAPIAGTVKEICVAAGGSVLEGVTLLVIE